MSAARRRRVAWALAALTATAFAACSFDEPDWSGKRCGGVDGTCPQGWRCDPVSSTCTTDPAGAPTSSGAGGAGGAPAGSGGGGGDCPGVPEDCATPGDDDCDGTANDHCALWHRQYSDDSKLQLPFDVAIDPLRGNVVAAGQATTGTDDNALIIGLGPGGTPGPWLVHIGDGAAQEVQGVGFDDKGNVLVAGIFEGTVHIIGEPLTSFGGNDIFVAKLESDGTPLWARQHGGPEDEQVHSMVVLPDGGVLLAGSTFEIGDFGDPPGEGRDAMVARLEPDGDILWSTLFGGGGGDSANEARLAGEGSEVVVVGDFAQTVMFDGVPHVAEGGRDVFVARLRADTGAFVSALTFGGPQNETASCVAIGADGAIYVTGSVESAFDILGQAQLDPVGTRDVFVARLSANGSEHVWSRRFGGRGAEQRADSVGLIGDRVYLAGALDGSVDFGGGALTVGDAPDVYVAALDAATGAHVWSRRFGLSGNQGYRGVSLDAQPNGLVIAGDFGVGEVDFGAGVLAGADAGDAFVVQLEP
jgi:hypothetical protein